MFEMMVSQVYRSHSDKCSGYPAFAAMLIVYWLMVFKPSL
jgi:uncharacterized membrane protein